MQSAERERQQEKDLEQLRDERSRLQEQLQSSQRGYEREKSKAENLTEQLNAASNTERGLRDELSQAQAQLKTLLDAKKKEGEKRMSELSKRENKLENETEDERILRISEEYRRASTLR